MIARKRRTQIGDCVHQFAGGELAVHLIFLQIGQAVTVEGGWTAASGAKPSLASLRSIVDREDVKLVVF